MLVGGAGMEEGLLDALEVESKAGLRSLGIGTTLS